MEPTSINELQRIRKLHISALTEADKIFLRARQSYLGRRDQAKYAEILAAEPVKVKTPRVKKVVNPLDHPANL